MNSLIEFAKKYNFEEYSREKLGEQAWEKHYEKIIEVVQHATPKEREEFINQSMKMVH